MTKEIVTTMDVKDRMIEVRGQYVLLDRDVAELYGVETKHINQAVKNNPDKFPEGYLLELSNQESTVLRSKILTLKQTNQPSRPRQRLSSISPFSRSPTR